MAELAVRSWRPASGFRARTRKTTRTAALRRASLTLLSTALAIAGLMVAFSSAAGAAVATPLVSTATSASGTSLHVTYNETPVLASSYSLTLTDGTHVDTLSSAAGTLSASISGTTINFTDQGSTSVSLCSLVEILGSTGISDASGNAWDLVASGQVDKFYLLKAGDSVAVTYNEPVTVGGSYSFTLSEGSASTTIDNGNSNVAGGNGSSTITYDLTNDPSGSVAADGPTASGTSGVTAAPTVQVGDTLKAVFTGSVTIGASYSLTLSDGSDAAGMFVQRRLVAHRHRRLCRHEDHHRLHGLVAASPLPVAGNEPPHRDRPEGRRAFVGRGHAVAHAPRIGPRRPSRDQPGLVRPTSLRSQRQPERDLYGSVVPAVGPQCRLPPERVRIQFGTDRVCSGHGRPDHAETSGSR